MISVANAISLFKNRISKLKKLFPRWYMKLHCFRVGVGIWLWFLIKIHEIDTTSHPLMWPLRVSFPDSFSEESVSAECPSADRREVPEHRPRHRNQLILVLSTHTHTLSLSDSTKENRASANSSSKSFSLFIFIVLYPSSLPPCVNILLVCWT